MAQEEGDRFVFPTIPLLSVPDISDSVCCGRNDIGIEPGHIQDRSRYARPGILCGSIPHPAWPAGGWAASVLHILCDIGFPAVGRYLPALPRNVFQEFIDGVHSGRLSFFCQMGVNHRTPG